MSFNLSFSEDTFILTQSFSQSLKSSASLQQEKPVHFLPSFSWSISRKRMMSEIKIQTNSLKIGDTIMFQGNKTGVKTQAISSMQLNKKPIKQAKKGQRVGVKTKTKIRKNDHVYKIIVEK